MDTYLPKNNSVYQLAKDIIARNNQDGTVILMKMDETNFFYKIDGIAAAVWSALQEKKTPATLIARFSKLYASHQDQVQRDIPVFFTELLKRNLIVEMPDAVESDSWAGEKPQQSKDYCFGGIKEFNLEQIETEVLNESVYLDVFAGSDLRLKKNITPVKNALSKILQLEGVTYQWASDERKDDAMHAGLIAQEVAAVMPELVRADAQTGLLGIEYSKITSYLVEAIKDLNRLVAAQDERIKTLEENFSQRNTH